MVADDGAFPPVTRRRVLTTLIAAGTAMTTGCHVFDPFRDSTEDKTVPLTTTTQPGAPSKYMVRVPPYLFFSDFEVEKNHPVFKELAGLRDQVYKELQLAPGNSIIQVYLFANRELYQKYIEMRAQVCRRAATYFFGEPQRLGSTVCSVYTFWGDRDRTLVDLRHELTHALLHSVLIDVPIWLDEGLAVYFEQPAERKGLNLDHVMKLRARKPEFKPDLARLEGLKTVDSMNGPEYQEAWAWVHLMLRGKPEAKKVLIEYLGQLRTTASAPPLLPALTKALPAPDGELIRHLEQLDRASQTR